MLLEISISCVCLVVLHVSVFYTFIYNSYRINQELILEAKLLMIVFYCEKCKTQTIGTEAGLLLENSVISALWTCYGDILWSL